jgi:hypothetical protein
MMLRSKVRFIWQSGFREEDFLVINQSEKRMACANMAATGNSSF